MNDVIPGEETETVPALGVWTASEQVETWAAPGGDLTGGIVLLRSPAGCRRVLYVR